MASKVSKFTERTDQHYYFYAFVHTANGLVYLGITFCAYFRLFERHRQEVDTVWVIFIPSFTVGGWVGVCVLSIILQSAYMLGTLFNLILFML